ncbi:hypothetical protein LCGC14_2081990 [marine sediment metagenome]|uniref:Uncharacterized protein n=1 Tax=marine sediment metagenome TaxID=412755 RepID=A0A0F9EFJ1_9ZZZZ
MREVAVVRVMEDSMRSKPYELVVDVGSYRLGVIDKRWKEIKRARESALRLAKLLASCKAGVDADVFEVE